TKDSPGKIRRTKAQRAEADRRATAYHEAGHVVAGCWLGLRFNSVDIIPNVQDNRLGVVDKPGINIPNHGRVSPEVAVELERRIISLLVGPAAEARYTGRLRWAHGQDDLKSAASMACVVVRGGSETEAEHYIRYLWIRATEILKRGHFWSQV